MALPGAIYVDLTEGDANNKEVQHPSEEAQDLNSTNTRVKDSDLEDGTSLATEKGKKRADDVGQQPIKRRKEIHGHETPEEGASKDSAREPSQDRGVTLEPINVNLQLEDLNLDLENLNLELSASRDSSPDLEDRDTTPEQGASSTAIPLASLQDIAVYFYARRYNSMLDPTQKDKYARITNLARIERMEKLLDSEHDRLTQVEIDLRRSQEKIDEQKERINFANSTYEQQKELFVEEIARINAMWVDFMVYMKSVTDASREREIVNLLAFFEERLQPVFRESHRYLEHIKHRISMYKTRVSDNERCCFDQVRSVEGLKVTCGRRHLELNRIIENNRPTQGARNHEQQILDLQNELYEVMNELYRAHGELNHTHRELDKTRGERNQARYEYDGIREEVQEYRRLLDETQDELAEARNEASIELTKARKAFHKTYRSLEKTCEQLKESNGKLDRTSLELEDSRRRLNESHENVLKSYGTIRDVRIDLLESYSVNSTVRVELNETQMKLDRTEAALERKKIELGMVQGELEESKFKLNDTQSGFKKVCHELREAKDKVTNLERLKGSK